MAKILVIVVTYNAMAWIEKCLGSVCGADIFVIDNGSTDGTQNYIREHFPKAVFVQSEKNLGFGAANNEGLKYALEHDYEFVYLLNQDAWLENDTLEKLISAWSEQYGILSPLQKSADGLLDKQFEDKCGKYLDGSDSVVEVPFVMAAHWLVSRKALETVGGFSPVFHQYGEDDNWIDRLHYHGFKAGVVQNASAVHDRAARQTSREQKMKRKCLIPVVKLCNPANNFCLRAVIEPIELLGMAIKNHSMILLRYIPELISRYGEFKAARKASFK